MTAIRRCIISTARSPPARCSRWSARTAPASRRCFAGIVGILKPLAGSILRGGLDVRDIAYLPQTADIDRSFPISVFDFVGTGLVAQHRLFRRHGQGARATGSRRRSPPSASTASRTAPIGTLSGGQMQRMLFARVLLQDAPLIVLDEPFNAIDAKTSADLLALVRRWHAEERTVLAALHDIDLVRANFPETLLLARGKVAWGATAEVLTSENLAGGAADVRGLRRQRRGLRRGRPAVAGRLTVMIYDALIAPFTEFEFMRRALAAVIALALGGAPIGVFLMLRRMSLVGDAMAHAILPGAAIGFLLSGLNLFAMTTGGLIAGFAVAILAGVVARTTELKEDASLATFYLVSLALGVTIVSIKGTNIDLLHVLFGNILAMDDQTLLVIAFNTTITLSGAGGDLSPVGDRKRRSGVPAHREPGRRAGASGVSGAGRGQSGQRLSRARHLAGGRADDPACRHRAVLVARHHRHDLHCGRERDASRAMPDWCCRSRPGCLRGRRSFWWPRCCTSYRCCSAASAASCGSCFPAATSKRNGQPDAASSNLADLLGAHGLDAARAGARPLERRRQLFDPGRFRAECRGRSRQCHDLGRSG